jgi:hypothetical protein
MKLGMTNIFEKMISDGTRQIHRRRFFACILYTLYLLLYTSLASAATLSIDPEILIVGPGDNFVATIRIETLPDECVNAVSVELLYPSDWMNASAVSKGESLMTLWPDEPSVDREKGRVFFSGGIPAGYCGRVQGDPGKTNILAKVIFSIPGNMIGGKVATGEVALPIIFGSSTKVLLNDGFGTPAPLLLKHTEYVRTLTSSGMKNEWLDVVHADNTPPDLFTITVEHDAHAFDGQNFIIFSAVDKQSGIHHYEVMEDDPVNLGFVYGKKVKSSFVVTASPYVLTDQTLQSRIIVRAYDHAGNMQEAVHAPTNGTSTTGLSGRNNMRHTFSELFSLQMIGGIFTLILLAVAGWWWVRVRNKKDISM